MKEFSHRVCAMRCALWFIDNDPDTDISELEQDSRIERYLSRHAHFCYDGRLFKPEHLRLMTLDRFRDLIREMGKRHATNAHTKDGIKHLWRVKSKGLSPEFLSKLEYDMETFTEADLPGPPDLTMGLVKSVFTKASDSETTDSNGSFQAERKADLRSHPNDARKFNGSKHMPIRRSQLIVVLDVEQSFANRSEKYLAHDTRLRALLLLIQQYGLTCYDQKTGTIIELEPSRLIKSLSNAFAGSERGTMAKLWDGRCSQAQNALKSSKEEVEQYEMANNLPTYDSIPFVHSSEDVELQLSRVERCGSHYEAGMEERSRTGGSAKHDEAPLSPIIRILDAARLTQPEKTLFSSSFSILVVIEDIDRSKDDQDRADYKYGSPERRMKALRMIIQQFSLQRWDKAEKAFVEMTEDKLQTMLKGFFYRCQAEKKQATPVNGTKTTPAILLWTQGSTVFEGVDMERLRENSQLLKEGLGADKGLLPIETTPSAEDASESSGEVAGGHRSSFLRERDITSETSEKSPSKLVRKRKAKEASLHSRSASPASRHERDLDFVPQDSPSPMAFQRKGETVSMPFLALSPMASPSGHSRRDSSRQRQSVATAESNRDQLVDGSSVGDTDPSMVAPTRMKSMSQEIDLRRLCTNIAGISSNIQHAVTSVFSNLRLDIMLPSPLPTASSEHLVALLSRCWGSDWRMTCHKMISSRVCSAINVLKALMTAFVFENIFAEDVSWQTDIFRSFALPMPSHQGRFTTCTFFTS